jgi:hypothetical protein
MRRIRMCALTMFLALGAIVPGAQPAAAAPPHFEGRLIGAGGFRVEGCGTITEIGSGKFHAGGLGHGTYSFRVCVTVRETITFAGFVTLTFVDGAILSGTISGTYDPAGGGPAFPVVVTGGTQRFARASGAFTIGPLVQDKQYNCDPRVGICFDWRDTGPMVGDVPRHL